MISVDTEQIPAIVMNPHIDAVAEQQHLSEDTAEIPAIGRLALRNAGVAVHTGPLEAVTPTPTDIIPEIPEPEYTTKDLANAVEYRDQTHAFNERFGATRAALGLDVLQTEWESYYRKNELVEQGRRGIIADVAHMAVSSAMPMIRFEGDSPHSILERSFYEAPTNVDLAAMAIRRFHNEDSTISMPTVGRSKKSSSKQGSAARLKRSNASIHWRQAA